MQQREPKLKRYDLRCVVGVDHRRVQRAKSAEYNVTIILLTMYRESNVSETRLSRITPEDPVPSWIPASFKNVSPNYSFSTLRWLFVCWKGCFLFPTFLLIKLLWFWALQNWILLMNQSYYKQGNWILTERGNNATVAETNLKIKLLIRMGNN